jgi:hypothetical protein
MTAGRGDLERPLGALLALHIGEIEGRGPRLGEARLARRQQLRALKWLTIARRLGAATISTITNPTAGGPAMETRCGGRLQPLRAIKP